MSDKVLGQINLVSKVLAIYESMDWRFKNHFVSYKEFELMFVVSDLFDRYLWAEMQDKWRGGNH